ncbi:hypothetical protein EXIGLDRAFT_153534 [Exidia glandulosa HHB12029]|uniref:Uncharacterized protein n=1 Tax=Exidia glandulosa HHB12029 TaxID=1314781 RepID=A0A165QGM4_EXIGL|nr:hypothetical protein EXIGLDRAFT_153534 [Exidia glandulosa HHB12029]
MTAITEVNAVLADNTEAFGAVNSGDLLNAAAKWCYLFTSPSAVSSQRFATTLQFFHDIGHSTAYARISPLLGIHRVAPLGSASKHACLVFDFSDIFATPAHLETPDAVSQRLETFIWIQTARFVRKCNGAVSFREPIDIDVRQYSGRDILQAVLSNIMQPVFVSVRGLDAVFDRAFVASLWESAPHPSLRVIHDVLNDCLFKPLAAAYEVSDGPLRKVLVTGRYPQLLISRTRLGEKLVDLSSLPEVAPLHGISISLLQDVLSATKAGHQMRAKEAIRELLVHCADRILRTPPDTVSAKKSVLDLGLVHHLLDTLIKKSSAKPNLDATQLVQSLEAALPQSAFASFHRLSELIFPLLGKNVPFAVTSINHGAWISGPMPDQFEQSYIDFLSQPWRDQAVGLLYKFGYLITRPLRDAGVRTETYELAGGCAKQSIRHVFVDHVKKYAENLPPRRDLPSLVPELVKMIQDLYRERPIADLPTTEEKFRKELMEKIREFIWKHGHLGSCVVTEVHVRYPPGTHPETCDGRVDIFLLERRISGPDHLYVLELKLRNLGVGTREPTTRYMEKTPSEEWKNTRTCASGTNQNFRCDLRDVNIPPDEKGWFVDRNATDVMYGIEKRSWEYDRLRLSHILCDHNIKDKDGSTRSPPHTVQSIVDDAIKQLKIYVKAICCGVEDEIGFLAGLADARVTSLGRGTTTVIPIVVVNIGCTLLNIQELTHETLDHRIAIIGSFPWTADRADKQPEGNATKLPKPNATKLPEPSRIDRPWMASRTVADVQGHKSECRFWRLEGFNWDSSQE